MSMGQPPHADDASPHKLADERTQADDVPSLHPGRVLAAVGVCMTIMIVCAAATLHGAAWCALGIPLAPLVTAGALLRRRRQ